MSFDSTKAAAHGREAVAIGEAGFYVAPSGKRVAITVPRSIEHRFDEPVPLPAPGARATRIEVVNQSAVASAKALAERGLVPSVLNFASAKNPGGGFTGGARAQEEALARSSALFAAIHDSPMYAHHRAHKDAIYTDWMIYSPAVPVFRDDELGPLVEAPFAASFITAPAPNAGVVLERQPERAAEVEKAMRARVTRSLAIAAHHGDTHLVLGAWGCGVFRNDPKIVADAYRNELDGAFRGVFDELVFAILDGTPERRFIAPFEARLG